RVPSAMRRVLSARTTLGFSPCHVSYFGTRRNAFRTFNSKNTAFDTKGDLQGQDILLKYAEQHKNVCYVLAFHREKKAFCSRWQARAAFIFPLTLQRQESRLLISGN
ncbi:MAG: hypothetical protein II681_06070, partial [Bacteroidaceae bacterium]|nr:hypothetical protein [Bacteroidaceae bacterium]